MTETGSNFRKMSFLQLLQNYSVEVPIIQRDYAQGRLGKEKLRTDFLEALRDALEGDPIELDFVFGEVVDSVVGEVPTAAFLPLDGQQRLTTLFLLHWYAAQREGSIDTEMERLLARFSYETRISSREFCRQLAKEPIISWVEGEKAVSDAITDCTWFSPSWRKDPTIQGMLIMLDQIHLVFCGVPNLLELLQRETNPPITFNFIRLKDFGLSDDLYIKMNARGKPLTAFENFKALLEKRINDEGWDSGTDGESSFSIKLDTTWTDLFWDLCPPQDTGLRKIDGAYLSFFAHCYACCIANRGTNAEVEAKAIQSILNNPEELDPKDFSQKIYEQTYTWLGVAADHVNGFDKTQLNYWHLLDNEKDHLLKEVVLDSGPLYQKRVVLHASLRFLEKNHEDTQSFDDWRRVIRNLVLNSRIESAEAFAGAIRLVDELAEGCSGIYDYLSRSEIKSDFTKQQIKEEQWKARLIELHPDQKALLHELEDTPFCKGHIDFALYCLSRDEDRRKATGSTEGALDMENLRSITRAISENFTAVNLPKVRKALLTLADPEPPPQGPRFFFEYWRAHIRWRDPVLLNYALIQDFNDFVNYSRNPKFRCFLSELVEQLIQTPDIQEIIERGRSSLSSPEWRKILLSDEGDAFWKNAYCNAYFAFTKDFSEAYVSRKMVIHDTETNQHHFRKDSGNLVRARPLIRSS